MRLWHYRLIPFLPKSQLLAQWRELNAIFKNQPRHILINYVYSYPKENLLGYASMVVDEMRKRGIEPKSWLGWDWYIHDADANAIVRIADNNLNPFPNHHTFHYLRQCYYNLEEKYERGQKDFEPEAFDRLHDFFETIERAVERPGIIF